MDSRWKKGKTQEWLFQAAITTEVSIWSEYWNIES